MRGIRRILFVVGVVMIPGCDPQLTDDPIPIIAFQDVVINLNLPEFQKLRTDGNMITVNGGVRGLIIYRVNANNFNAYERNCSYHPNEAGSTVDIDQSNLFLKDYSCGSQFSKESGQPQGGPAWRPLRRYRTNVTGSTLTITSDAIE